MNKLQKLEIEIRYNILSRKMEDTEKQKLCFSLNLLTIDEIIQLALNLIENDKQRFKFDDMINSPYLKEQSGSSLIAWIYHDNDTTYD